MIELSFARDLVSASDPLMVIWEEMVRRCGVDERPPLLSDTFERTEEALSALERFVYDTFFEAYDLLLERGLQRAAQPQKAASDFLFGHAEFVLLADSLSVREAALWTAGGVFQLDPNWKVAERTFAVAPFPMKRDMGNVKRET